MEAQVGTRFKSKRRPFGHYQRVIHLIGASGGKSGVAVVGDSTQTLDILTGRIEHHGRAHAVDGEAEVGIDILGLILVAYRQGGLNHHEYRVFGTHFDALEGLAAGAVNIYAKIPSPLAFEMYITDKHTFAMAIVYRQAVRHCHLVRKDYAHLECIGGKSRLVCRRSRNAVLDAGIEAYHGGYHCYGV